MPGDRIGEVYYGAHIRGDDLNREAKSVGRSAGADLGDEMGNSFDRRFGAHLSSMAERLLPYMKKQGKLLGDTVGDYMERGIASRNEEMKRLIGESFISDETVNEVLSRHSDIDKSYGKLRDSLQRLRDENQLNERDFGNFNEMLDRSYASLKRVADQQDELVRRELNANKVHADSINALRNEGRQADTKSEQVRNLVTHIRNLIDGERDAALASDDHSAALKRSEINTYMQRLRDTVLEEDRLRDAVRKTTSDIDKHSSALNRNGAILKNHQSLMDKVRNAWLRTDSTVRLAVIGIAVAGQEIATLGSAAGAGITILGGAAAAGALGIGSFVAMVANLGGEISNLPAEVQPAAMALTGLKDSFKNLQAQMQIAGASSLTSMFTSLTATIQGLTPLMAQIGATVADSFNKMALSIAPGTAGFEKLQGILQGLGPVFSTLMDAAQGFFGAMGSIFNAMLPYVQRFADWFAQLMDNFNAWASSLEGQTAIQQWAENAMQVFGALGDLIASLSHTLADLVTPESVANLIAFINNLSDFLPVAGQILGVLGGFNILGIIGQLFQTLSSALEPLLPVLQDVASAFGSAIINALRDLTPSLTDLARAVAPLISSLGKLAVTLFQALEPAIGPIIEAFAQMAGPIAQVANVLAETLGPVVEPLAKAFADLVVAIMPFIRDALVVLAPLLAPILTSLGSLVPLIQGLAGFFNILAGAMQITLPIMQLVGEVIGTLIGSVVALLTGDFSKLGELWSKLWTDIQQVAVDMATQLLNWLGSWGPNVLSWWNGLWDSVSKFLSDTWNNILSFVLTIADNIMQTFTNWGTSILKWWNQLWTDVYQAVSNAWTTIVNFFAGIPGWILSVFQGALGWLVDSGRNILQGLHNGVTEAWQNVVSWFSGVGSSIVGFLSGASSWLVGIGRDIINGLWNGISGAWNWIVDQARGLFGGFVDVIRGILGIHSPSKVFAEIGGNISEGFAQGIMQNTGIIKRAFGDMTKIAENAKSDILGTGIVDAMGSLGITPGSITPADWRNTSMSADPAVRAVATPATSGPGDATPGRYVTVAPGAVNVITPTKNPEQVASMVLDRLVEEVLNT